MEEVGGALPFGIDAPFDEWGWFMLLGRIGMFAYMYSLEYAKSWANKFLIVALCSGSRFCSMKPYLQHCTSEFKFGLDAPYPMLDVLPNLSVDRGRRLFSFLPTLSHLCWVHNRFIFGILDGCEMRLSNAL